MTSRIAQAERDHAADQDRRDRARSAPDADKPLPIGWRRGKYAGEYDHESGAHVAHVTVGEAIRHPDAPHIILGYPRGFVAWRAGEDTHIGQTFEDRDEAMTFALGQPCRECGDACSERHSEVYPTCPACAAVHLRRSHEAELRGEQ